MRVLHLNTRAERKRFLAFRAKLYRGDSGYVCTERFVLENVLFGETDFARSCTVRPIAIAEGKETRAQAVLIFNRSLPLVQISFFDALPDCGQAVKQLVSEAEKFAEEVKAEGIIAGLNAHISYGVGILTEGFGKKTSFDSLYNKSYYKDYFSACESSSLSTYKAAMKDAVAHFPRLRAESVRIRPCDMRDYRGETEKMRLLCERTIARTHLYFATEPLHFYQLTKSLKPFLRSENLLFAEDENKNLLGFLFWHPDFNQTLAAGREYGTAGIAAAWALKRKRIDTVKVNALGSLSRFATFALIDRFRELVENRYAYVETNFVWDNNLNSSLLMRKIFKTYDRKYEVYRLK